MLKTLSIKRFHIIRHFFIVETRYIRTEMWKLNVEISQYRDEYMRTSLSILFFCLDLNIFYHPLAKCLSAPSVINQHLLPDYRFYQHE